MNVHHLPELPDQHSLDWVHLCMWAFVAAAGAWLTYHNRLRIREAWRSRYWTPTEGTVIRVDDASFEIDSVSQYSTARRTRFGEDRLTVVYHVSGRTFQTQNYSFGGHVDQSFGVFRPGQVVTVHFDPACPGNAVVRKGLPVSLALLPFATVVAIGFVFRLMASAW